MCREERFIPGNDGLLTGAERRAKEAGRFYTDTGDLLCELVMNSVVADLLSHHGVTVFSALPRELEHYRNQFDEPEGQEPGFSSEVARALGLSDPEVKTSLTPVQVFRRLLMGGGLAANTLRAMGVNLDQLLKEAQGVTHAVLEELQAHPNR